jgi:hypothetical protein
MTNILTRRHAMNIKTEEAHESAQVKQWVFTLRSVLRDLSLAVCTEAAGRL